MNRFLVATIWLVIFFCLLATQPALAETVTYYHTDPVGTPLAMTDQSGAKIWEADYLPFGEVYSETTESGVANDRKFVGKERDEESGLDYFGARYHYAKIGRFLAVDPIRAVDARTGKINSPLLVSPQRQNTYAYGLNNPYRYVDPDGDFAILVPLGIVTAGTLIYAQWHIEQHREGMITTANAIKGRVSGAWGVLNEKQNKEKEVDGSSSGDNSNVQGAKKAVEGYLGENAKARKNKDGDIVIESADGNRKIRFDIKNPSPHENAHGHVEWKTEQGNWRGTKAIYPKDVPKK